MASEKKYLALDMGAESGRGVLGLLKDGRLRLEETHRFVNSPVDVVGSLQWDLLRQFSELKVAVAATVARHGALDSLGVDTWGVDFTTLGHDGAILGNPYHYRDKRTEGMMEAAFERMPQAEIFENTGIQFMPLNSIFQLFAMVQGRSPLLDGATRLLFMPDLFNYLFTGEQTSEFSIATTSQLYDVRKKEWAAPVFEKLGLPLDIMPPVLPTGSRVGRLLDAVAAETGAGPVTVIAPATHDTGSAVMAVPAVGDDWAYLSSGTWSLIGIEIPHPIVTPEVLELSFTNEGGVNGTTRFLKNIMGLWLVQRCRSQWASEGVEYDYAQMAQMAEDAAPLQAFVNPNDTSFAGFVNMPEAIRAYCQKTGQTPPDEHGAIIRCALESLALIYRTALKGMEAIKGRPIQTLHIVGGGSQNRLLNQLTANALGIPVITGPIEATAIGNCLAQAIADGEIASLEEARSIVRASFDVETYEPQDGDTWAEAIERFDRIIRQAD